ncbi:hypothetical protein MMC15_003668 [Xylographa vitiligo]|nr:hypothetical protein [Xylographa vitiligo]
MPTLTTLPNEVLHQILLYVEHETATLLSLSLLTPALHTLARPHLYRHITLYVSTRRDPISARYELLMRTLKHAPSPAPLVRHLELTLPKGVAESYTRANALLRRLSGLTTLRISASRARTAFTPTFLAEVLLPELASLTVEDPQLSIPVLVSWLVSPALRSLTAPLLRFPAQPPDMPPPLMPPSPLAALNLGTTHVPLASLVALLDRMPRLERLSLAVPGLPTAYSPAAIAGGLDPVRASLRVLDVCSGVPPMEDLAHDGSRLDLSAFGALREVNVPAGCLFATKRPARKGRDGVGALLPGSLEVLQISFDFSWGILYLDDGFPAFQAAGHGAVERGKWAWLEELARGKKQGTWPGLRAVRLEERIKQPRGFRYDRLVWQPPGELAGLFEEVGVELVVWLRAPMTGKGSRG